MACLTLVRTLLQQLACYEFMRVTPLTLKPRVCYFHTSKTILYFLKSPVTSSMVQVFLHSLLCNQKNYLKNKMDQTDYSIWNTPINKIIDSGKEKVGNLFVGGYKAGALECLQEHSIQAVVTAAKDCDVVSFKPEDGVIHLRLEDADDVDDFDISKYFDSTFKFIDLHLAKTNVLVHCMAGAQRSVTIIVAYIIRKWKMGATEALAYVKERRKIADPNEGFINQLNLFATRINSTKPTQGQLQKVQTAQKVQTTTKTPSSKPANLPQTQTQTQTQTQPKPQPKPLPQPNPPLHRNQLQPNPHKNSKK